MHIQQDARAAATDETPAEDLPPPPEEVPVPVKEPPPKPAPTRARPRRFPPTVRNKRWV